MSNASPDRIRPWFLLGIGVVLALSGCVTTYDRQAEMETARQEDYRILMQEIRKLEGRIEGLEMESDRLARTVDGATRDADRIARAGDESLRASVQALEARMQGLESARVRDREEIVDQLTRKMAELMRERPAGRAAAPPARAGGSQYGYEHVVAAGENLSRIAAAYGSTVKAIVEANGLGTPDQLQVGQKLFIPE